MSYYYTLEEQAQHRAELVEALRSGKYKQAVAALRSGDRFCCLGVACDLSGIGEWETEDEDHRGRYHVDGDSSVAILPEPVRDYYGFASPEGNLDINKRVAPGHLLGESEGLIHLAAENDRGASFEEIAEWIENGTVLTRAQ